MFQPVIKWSGSKRPIAQDIVDLFPREINNYYEPFCGGASVMRCLLDNIKENKIKVNGNIITIKVIQQYFLNFGLKVQF